HVSPPRATTASRSRRDICHFSLRPRIPAEGGRRTPSGRAVPGWSMPAAVCQPTFPCSRFPDPRFDRNSLRILVDGSSRNAFPPRTPPEPLANVSSLSPGADAGEDAQRVLKPPARRHAELQQHADALARAEEVVVAQGGHVEVGAARPLGHADARLLD